MNVERSAGALARVQHCAPVGMARPDRSQAGAADFWINTIQLYRFPLALAVVAVHSGQFVIYHSAGASSGGGSGGPSLWIVEFLTMVSRLATPSFLLIAGFLFFRNGPVSFDQYRRKLHTRCYTLLLPYLVWNSMAVLLLCALPACHYLFLGTWFDTASPFSFRSLTKGFVGWPVYPADAPLWFVRDLLLLVAVAPILTLVPKRVQLLGLGALALYWLMGPIDLIPGGIPRAGSVCFFCVGAWMGINRLSLRDNPAVNKIMIVAAGVFVFSAAAGASFATADVDHAATKGLLERIVRGSGALLVVCATMKPIPFPPLAGLLLRLSPASFFLFAFHYGVLSGLSVPFKYLPQGLVGVGQGLFVVGALFAVVVAVSLGCYFLLRRYAPSLLSLLDGNRSARGSQTRRGDRQLDVSLLEIGSRPTPSFH
jgi:surface polysaccharide O-acyltransferase-like enzyme